MIALPLVAAASLSCAPSAQVAPAARAEPRLEAPSAPGDAGMDAGDAGRPRPMATLETLASRAPGLASGMREVGRFELTFDGAETTRVVARAEERDTCVRVALVTSAAVKSSVVNGRGAVLAESNGAADDTSLGTQGPVCVRKGDAVTLRLASPGSFAARYVVWVSP